MSGNVITNLFINNQIMLYRSYKPINHQDSRARVNLNEFEKWSLKKQNID